MEIKRIDGISKLKFIKLENLNFLNMFLKNKTGVQSMSMLTTLSQV